MKFGITSDECAQAVMDVTIDRSKTVMHILGMDKECAATLDLLVKLSPKEEQSAVITGFMLSYMMFVRHAESQKAKEVSELEKLMEKPE